MAAFTTNQVKFLIIRRDNIGDLICTTPLIRALREHFPTAWVGAWVNTYNAPILEGNPDLNAIFAYEKAKHRRSRPRLQSYWERLRMLQALRALNIDYVILAGPAGHRKSFYWARLIGAKHIIGHTQPGFQPKSIDLPVLLSSTSNQDHEVEIVYRLGEPLGITGKPPALKLGVTPRNRAAKHPSAIINSTGTPLRIGLHLSSRKVSQRWPVQNYVALARESTATLTPQPVFSIFWSPGSVDNPEHPGDDEKAAEFAQQADGLAFQLVPTQQLTELVNNLAQCDLLICSDGGAMHIGAALGLPIVCLFGRSDPKRWYPWGVPFELLQHASQEVENINVAMVMTAIQRLLDRVALQNHPHTDSLESSA